MKTSGVFICIPAYGESVMAKTMESVYCLSQYFASVNITNHMSWFSAADIVEVRNMFLTIWYDAHPHLSHLLFIDADMGFPPELVRDMLRFQKPLVGCLYAKRKSPIKMVGTLIEGKDSEADVQHGFLPAHDLGCGVMLIERSVVTKMLLQMPEISDSLPGVLADATPVKLNRLIRAFDPIRTNNIRFSEDVSFCHRWRECGGEIWANVNHRISHVGPFDFAVRYAAVMPKSQEKAA